MKLTGNLKKQVEKAETKDEEIRKADFSELSAQSRTGSPLPSVGGSDEKKSLIENAGMLLSDDELENVAGGKSNAYKTYEIYCAGVVACNGKVITQGCDFKETFPSYEHASQTMTKKYKNLCPNCIKMCIKHPLALREI